MLKDITIGQYFPGSSLIHRLDPRFKIIITFIYILMLFTGSSVVCLAVGAVYTVGAVILSRIPVKMFWKSVKPLLPFLILTALLNLFLVESGDTVFHWRFIKITDGGINISVFMLIRIVLLIAGSSLLTYTTSPITLTDAIERLMSPLKILRFPVHELAMMMSIALRFIPTLMDETDKIMKAQTARGADFESGGLVQKAKNLVPLLVPLFVSAFRIAGDLAMAMEARCYKGGEGRTRMTPMRYHRRDAIALVLLIAYLAATVVISRLNVF